MQYSVSYKASENRCSSFLLFGPLGIEFSGMVLSGTMPLPKPALTNTTCQYMTSLSHNVSTKKHFIVDQKQYRNHNRIFSTIWSGLLMATWSSVTWSEKQWNDSVIINKTGQTHPTNDTYTNGLPFYCKHFREDWPAVSGLIRSSDNDSTGLWPPGSLHTLGADGHI